MVGQSDFNYYTKHKIAIFNCNRHLVIGKFDVHFHNSLLVVSFKRKRIRTRFLIKINKEVDQVLCKFCYRTINEIIKSCH